MKLFYIYVLLIFYLPLNTLASKPLNNNQRFVFDNISKLDSIPNLWQSGSFYFGGQPTMETLHFLKQQGTKCIVNLRSDKENQFIKKGYFDEQKQVEHMEIDYVSIPLGNKKDYCPEAVNKLNDAILGSKGNIFIHCASGGRVNYIFMAWLVKYQGYSVQEAIETGKKLGYRIQLEEFLNKEMEFSFKD